jgi:transcription elongation factor GreA
MDGSRREPITPEGHARLTKEIEHIKFVERPANIKAIEEARSHGDLSENAEYSAAREEQGLIAARLAKYEDLLARAEVIDPKAYKGQDIVFGATVDLVDIETDDEHRYQIVGTYEADPSKGRISVDSPIAKSLIGKSEGEEVRVRTPRGERNLAITKVRYL